MPSWPCRALLRALVAGLPLLAAGPAVAWEPRQPAPVTLTGTYELLAVDRENAEGGLTHDYREVLRVPGGDAVSVRLPAGHGLTAGTTVRVSAQPAADAAMTYDVGSVTRLAPSSTMGSPGTTSVLVILAYWSKPDSMTRTRAATQFFEDDDKWYREVSYGKAGLAGVVTPWVKIPAPRDGLCLAHAETMLSNAKSKAAALGATYNPERFARTVLYFPRCTGGDTTGIAGWAYEPGSASWLNGTMDRRTTVHEQGHNFGMGHAHSLVCKSSTGARVTFSRSCVVAAYGDPYDAMGRSAYVAHFTGYRKDQAGWLGTTRKRTLSAASSTFTLPPFERPATLPNVVVALSPKVAGRSYWLEYRRPVGADARLPSGATGGVLVHVRDGSRFGLLDLSPHDATMTTAVLKPGQTWTAPDYVKFTVGYLSSSGARVTVTGAKVAPKVPTAPRSLAAVARDESAEIGWQPPSSNGGSDITEYHVRAVNTATGTVREKWEPPWNTATLLTNLANGVTHNVSVRARNGVGWGPVATTTVKPYPMNPTVRLLTPAAGATVSGSVTLTAQGTPHPVSESRIYCYRYYVDDLLAGTRCGGMSDLAWHTKDWANGDHTVRVVATDYEGRAGSDGPHTVTVLNPYPAVAITSPAPGTYDATVLTVTADASVPSGGATVASVTFYDLANGYDYPLGTDYSAPYEAPWRLGWTDTTRTVVAVARSTTGLETRSEPRSVQVVRAPPTVAITSPADGATVSGTSVTLTADARSHAEGASVSSVMFYAGGTFVARDDSAPYSVVWDTTRVTGPHGVRAVVVEDNGRSATALATVTVANVLPTVRITAPADGQDVYQFPLTISGTSALAGGVPSRVEVRVGVSLIATVTPASDGSWSAAWNGQYWSYGTHRVSAVAFTADGLASAESSVSVDRLYPYPTVTVESPESGALLAGDSETEVVATVTRHQYATATVVEVCASYSGTKRCVPAPGADGRYRIPWTVVQSSGHTYVSVYARLSDGAVRSVMHDVVVARPPAVPGVSAVGIDSGARITLYEPWGYQPIPVLGYTVTVGDRTIEVGTAGTFTVEGLTNGTTYAVSVVARNAVGTSPAATTTVTPRPTGTITTVGSTASLRWSETFTAVVRVGADGAAAAGETVVLRECHDVGWYCRDVGSGVTGADGTVTLAYVPGLALPVIEAQSVDSATLAASPVATFRPQMFAKVTATLNTPSVTYGAGALLTGAILPAFDDGTVTLQRRVSDGSWQPVTQKYRAPSSNVLFPLDYGRGTWTFRLLFTGTELRGTSNEVTLTVV